MDKIKMAKIEKREWGQNKKIKRKQHREWQKEQN